MTLVPFQGFVTVTHYTATDTTSGSAVDEWRWRVESVISGEVREGIAPDEAAAERDAEAARVRVTVSQSHRTQKKRKSKARRR